MSKADMSKHPEQVSGMFDGVAAGYDLTNSVLSAGNDRLWRVATTRAVAPKQGERILDLAAGTGTSTVALARTGAHVVGADFSPGMIEVARRKHSRPGVEFVEADAMNLPFDDASFDAVTISFGLRNVAEPRVALDEMFRVLKPGGRLVICEFSTPPVGLVRAAYDTYLSKVLPTVAGVTSTNRDAYDYLAESILAWPDQIELTRWIRGTGFTRVAYRNLTAGIVALHRGHKPADARRTRRRAAAVAGAGAPVVPETTAADTAPAANAD